MLVAAAIIFVLFHGLPFWLFKGAFKVSSGTVRWYRNSYGTDLEIPYTIHYILFSIYYLLRIIYYILTLTILKWGALFFLGKRAPALRSLSPLGEAVECELPGGV